MLTSQNPESLKIQSHSKVIKKWLLGLLLGLLWGETPKVTF